MFDFAVRGTVVGFNTTQDGTKSFIKVQPSGSVQSAGLQRDERPGVLDILVPQGPMKTVVLHAAVVVRGKAMVLLRDWRNPREGTTKTYVNYRFEAETVEPAKA